MEGTLAEIRMFAGNFNPRGWMFCQGQLLPIAQWTAVFALVGTTYGGDGITTFGVPDLRGRFPVGSNNGATGPGLPTYQTGEKAGTNSTTLIATNLPLHNHILTGTVATQVNNDTAGLTDDATNRRFGTFTNPNGNTNNFTSSASDLVSMLPMTSTLAAGVSGSNQPFSKMPPYLGMNYIFCVEGIFPSRN